MDVCGATKPIPGRVNDDAFVLGPHFAAVLDGCTEPAERDSGCVHDVPWLVSQLSGHLAAALSCGGDQPLPDLLAAAIEATCRAHRHSCDLSNPDSPSSTVTILRETGDRVDYLVLADSPLVLRYRDGAVTAIIDDQVDKLPDYRYESVARLRNRPGGFWVASTVANAGEHGITGSVAADELTHALLLTDGASRLAERYDHSWAQLMELAEKAGPRAVLEEVHSRDAIAARTTSVRGKIHDDATAVWCGLPG